MNEVWNRKEGPQRRRPLSNRQNAGPRPQQSGSRGNASRSHARYLLLAREATLAGDAIEAENFYQHAEHYFRVMQDSERGGKD
jgi:Domain of unknown function (DUF4167)